MDYGAIIKKAWKVTWRYKALWVLGIFAGVSGCQGSYGGNSRYTTGSSETSSKELNNFLDRFDLSTLDSWLDKALPVVILLTAALITVGIIWSLISVAAKGGLIAAVNASEEGRRMPLGEAWSAGFSKFGPLLGLEIILKFPVFVLAMIITAAVLIPVILAVTSGGGEDAAAPVIGGLCGGLAALPVLLILSLVVDVVFLIAVRYLVLGGQGVVESVRNAWAFLHTRFKDTALMYLIGGVLNTATAFLIGIFALLLGLAAGFGGVAIADWGRDAAVFAGAFLAIALILSMFSLVYTAIWGTFTSSLWTIFFRRVTGMEPPAAVAYAQPTPPTQPAPLAPPTSLEPLAPPMQPTSLEPPAPPAPAAPPATEEPPA